MAEVADVYSCKIVTRTEAATNRIYALNILHYRVVTKLNLGATDQQIADAMDALWGPIYRAFLPSVLTGYRGIITQRVFPLPLTLARNSINNQGQGLFLGGDLLPGQVCGMVTKLTAAAGRRFRGRVYVPFPLETDNDGIVPSAAYVARINPVALAQISQITAGVAPNQNDLQNVIFSRALPAVSVSVTNAIVRSYWTTQRRRNAAFGSDETIL